MHPEGAWDRMRGRWKGGARGFWLGAVRLPRIARIFLVVAGGTTLLPAGTRLPCDASAVRLPDAAASAGDPRASVEAVAPAPGARWRTVERDYVWSFPRDHGTHPGFRNEWWYFVGHLADRAGHIFGYQLTLFRIGIAPSPPDWRSSWTASDIVIGHLGITDVTETRHLFTEALYRAIPLLGGFGGPDSLLAWSQAPPGTEGHWAIRWNGDGFDLEARDHRAGIALALSATPSRAPLLQGPNGYSRKSHRDDAASHYYSLTRLETRGTLQLEQGDRGSRTSAPLDSVSGNRTRTLEVTGISWMDHEFSSNQLGATQVGWDWFALQLDDGRDLMLYLLRDEERIDYAHGTLREANGSVRWLDPGHWRLRAQSTWKSPGGARYPSGWKLEIPSERLDLEIVPLILDQENVSALVSGVRYWEGAVEARSRGRRVGQGYVELTGYGESGRLPF